MVFMLQVPNREFLWPCHPHSTKIITKLKISLAETENKIDWNREQLEGKEKLKHTEGRGISYEEVDDQKKKDERGKRERGGMAGGWQPAPLGSSSQEYPVPRQLRLWKLMLGVPAVTAVNRKMY